MQTIQRSIGGTRKTSQLRTMSRGRGERLLPRLRRTPRGVLPTVMLLLALPAGCGNFLANQGASLGGSTAGSRGAMRVLVINNTPYRAVFTMGSFDQTDPRTAPDFRQFEQADRDPHLDGGERTDLLSFRCARLFSVGGERLLSLIRANVTAANREEDALVDGVAFFEIDPDSGDAQPRGVAPALDAFIGVDFTCGSLLIVTLEIDDFGPDPFRIDFSFIPSSSTR